MKHILALFLFTNFAYGQTSQIKWMDPTQMKEQCIDGRGWKEGYSGKEGIKDIYELTARQIGFDTESALDGTHPNDIGMMQYANAYYHLIRNKIGLLK
jgi:hypothetical protein